MAGEISGYYKSILHACQMEGGIMVCGDAVLLDFGVVLWKFLF